jgi:hypothetical protein
MGSVFAATHLRNANRVAVKILHPEFEENSDIRARFLREGYAANSIRHAGTVRVLDDDIADDGSVFFVMELLEGETLEALWERGGRRLPPREVAALMCQLLDILSAAHERGIVHRDVKPENLFIERDGTLRVLDFGVARVLEGTLTETRAGSVIGTLPYMAPEQMLGKSHDVDARSDIWSVGATAFTLVSGRFVQEAETAEEMLVFTASRQARSLGSVAPQVPRAFVQVVDRALRFDKIERWPSALAMQAAFAEVCRSSSADIGIAAHEPPVLATIVSSSRSTMRDRAGVVSSVTSAMVPIRGTNDVAPAAQLGALWLRGAAIVAAVAVAGTIAALTPRAGRSPPAALATVLIQPPLPLPLFASQAAILVAPVDTNSARETALTSTAPAASVAAPTALGTKALDRASGAAPSGPKGIVAKAPSPAMRIAADPGPRGQQPSVGSTAPDACSPPFTIVAVTGKKTWKRECL